MLAVRTKELRRCVHQLCPPDSARNARVRGPETRRNYHLFRVENADALDVRALCDRFPDAMVYLRDGGEAGCALDVYLPFGSAAKVRAVARLLWGVAAGALVLAFAGGLSAILR